MKSVGERISAKLTRPQPCGRINDAVYDKIVARFARVQDIDYELNYEFYVLKKQTPVFER